MEKEHTALEELFHCVLIVLLRKQWQLVMADQRMTALGVSRNIKYTLPIIQEYKFRVMKEPLFNHINFTISVPCVGAHYLHQATGCQSCEVGTFSPGGTVSSCVSCSEGKSVAAGQGSSESDCSWSKCTTL